MKGTFWIAGLIICGTMSQVSAQDIPVKELFIQLDKNKDQVLTLDEIPEGQTRFFERVLRVGDMDANGKVTLKEFELTFQDRPSTDSSPPQELKREAVRPDAAALQQRPDPAQLFQRLDRNGDGSLTRDELPPELAPRLQGLFDRLGTDSISLEQFRQASGLAGGDRPGFSGAPNGGNGFRERMSPDGMRGSSGPGFGHLALIRVLDVDGNGTLNQQELANAAAAFAQLDANGDGELDAREILGMHRGGPGGEGGFRGPGRDGGAGFGPGGRSGGPGGERGPEGAGFDRRPPGASGPIDVSAFFQRLDTNSDGILTRDELPERMQDRLQMIDSNQDGMISPEELAGMLQNMRGPMGPSGQGPNSGNPPPSGGLQPVN